MKYNNKDDYEKCFINMKNKKRGSGSEQEETLIEILVLLYSTEVLLQSRSVSLHQKNTDPKMTTRVSHNTLHCKSLDRILRKIILLQGMEQ